VNAKIGNLRQHIVTTLHVDRIREGESVVTLNFKGTGEGQYDFGLRLDGVIEFVDQGTVLEPLTAGVVWGPIGTWGRRIMSKKHLIPPQGLVEIRLDFEDEDGLMTRFQAVATKTALTEGKVFSNQQN
jgi:hypothetical protein